MPISFSNKDIELLGYIEPTLLFDDHFCSLYKTQVNAGLEKVEALFVYLKSSCTVEDAKNAEKKVADIKLPNNSSTYIVVPKSFGLTQSTIQTIFGKEYKIYNFEDLVWNKLSNIFDRYLESIKRDVVSEKYFVTPRKKDALPTYRLDSELFAYFTDKKNGKSDDIIVLSAPAAVGKTTLARHVILNLAVNAKKYHVIPLYVESQHWRKIQLDSVDDLWEIVDNSLRTFGGSISLSKDLLKYILRQGYFCFIFDGFDELCSQKNSHFKPIEILRELIDISKESDARILITTRALYWETEIVDTPSGVIRVELLPFNTQQAKDYFSKHFKQDFKTRDLAIKLYSDLIKGSGYPPTEGGVRAQFVNLPLCVALIAQYVVNGGRLISSQNNSRKLVQTILLEICRREIARKGLITSPENQLLAFQEMAILDIDNLNPEIELEMLEPAGFDKADIIKLIDHPFLSKQGKQYKFEYEFLGPYLRAAYLSKFISDNLKPNDTIWKIMANESNGKRLILEHMASLLAEDQLSSVRDIFEKIPPKFREAKSFLFHLTQLMLDSDPNIISKEDRVNSLFNMIFGKKFNENYLVSNLYISGPINRLDLTGIKFLDCTLHFVSFNNCLVNDTTVFENCTFSGGIEVQPKDYNKDGWKNIKLNKCSLLFPANLELDAIKGGIKESTEDYIRDAIYLALSKFWYHGRIKRSINKDDWSKGSLYYTRYCDSILDAMLKVGFLEEIHISGLSKGGYALAKEANIDMQNFMDNRQLTGMIKQIYDLLED